MAEEQIWTKHISSKQKLFDLKLKQVWEYRDLVGLFVKRDFVTYYKQTIFGPLWYLFQPIINSIMYIIIFGNLAGLGTDDIPQPLFYFSGTMLWTYFSDSMIRVSNVFFDNRGIFSKVYFPRLTSPIATSIGLIIKLLIQFALFLIMFVFYYFKGANVHFYATMLFFPLIVLWLMLLSVGLGMIISAFTTKYRDLALILGPIVSLAMYITPVVYPLSEVSDSLRMMFYINPVSTPVELFRVCFFNAGYVPLNVILLSLGITLFCLLLGLTLFNHNERSFVDVI